MSIWIRPHVDQLIVVEPLVEWDYVLTLEPCRNRELAREKVWSRIYLVPLLMAEGDRDLYRREQAALGREREIMKDVHGWEVCDRFRIGEHGCELRTGGEKGVPRSQVPNAGDRCAVDSCMSLLTKNPLSSCPDILRYRLEKVIRYES